ncbi:PolC-type DNA polymerase III [Peloplasma aerotolerans]|uniref:DNA polymerase III PolC-type n=1 Tax=Peloplasma aerotolerans TaxID=3044389 RepID=A0AAW6UD44_9MOLU|nr:PolC-type DNA polymerase III [Mariniplasma sp. M4Ah]MDI6453564.1 PolC-type DNA polymerase III [Mariniplasma sp. M4Ah]
MNKDKFTLFLEQSKFASPVLKQAVLDHVSIDVAKKRWIFHITLLEVVGPEVLLPFIQTLKSYFHISKIISGVDVVLQYQSIETFEKYAMSYFDYAVIELSKEKARFLVLKNYKTRYEDKAYIIAVDQDSTYINEYFKEIQEVFLGFGLEVQLKLEVIHTLTPTSQLIQTSINEQEKVLEQKQEYAKQNIKQQNKKTFTKKSNPQAIAIKEIPLDQYRLDQYKNEKGDTYFLIEGEISKLEVRDLTNSTLMTFVLGDDDDAIYVKRFIKSEKDRSLAQSLNDGDFIQVSGVANFDTFQKDVVVYANAINFIEKDKKEERLDKAKEKRVELHVHTKMSNMDAVNDPTEYVNQAIKWGHEAIAFTDHNGLYAYPEIYKATKGKDIKPIYGVELDFVDETMFKITSDTDQKIMLKDAKYIVFDIETTGLSSTRDKIIEIAAVKIESGSVTERYQTFINPGESLSNFTTELTDITDEMLENAPTIADALPEFLKFIEGGILVAHNALFDVGHIKENAKALNLKFDDSLIIDTLNLSRYFYNHTLKRFNLKAVAKSFKVKQEQHHRAEDDAYVTAQIWLSMLNDLLKKNIKQYHEINENIDEKEAWKHIMPYHINLLTQSQVGYKNLFRIVSDALTTHFYSGPRTLKSVLSKYREGLLVGSGCAKGDVFEAAFNRGDDDLKAAISFYDYIEVQPPQAYKHLKDQLGAYGDEIIEAVITKIVRFAKEQDKIIIASGDVHYLEKKDVLYREIYIRTPLVGGGIHDLSRYDTMPEQYFLTTDEMMKSMAFLGKELAYEIVVKNTQLLNNMIEKIQAFPKQLYSLPDDAFKDLLGIDSISSEVRRLVYDKMQHIYGVDPHQMVRDRVTRELKNIIENEFAPNYYISHLLVKKSLDDGYLVGSRGSVGSSLIATLLDITEVNPLKPHYRCSNGDFTAFYLTDEEIHKYGLSEEQKAFQPFMKGIQSGFDLPTKDCPICGKRLVKDGHDIPFETFLGFDGDKIPDIDLNFSGDYQSIAHTYVRELIGEDHTFRAGTIQTVAERNAYGYVKGYLEDKKLEVRSAQIERLAKKIEGVKRSTGQHPGGIVVVPKSKTIYDVTPIQFPADDVTSEWKTTHFDYHSFEANLLKLDILGHDDPTMIKFLMDYVFEHPKEFPFDKAQDIPLDDPRVYELFSGTSIIGVKEHEIMSEVASYAIPEFGTPFTRQMLQDTKPNTFAGLVKISGLSHGTDVWLKNAQNLVTGNTEHGKIPFDDIIACRDDIMVQLTERGLQPLKAFDIMEFVRKGKPSKDKATWLDYEQEMRKNNVPEWYIWSASQIKYMFPKAHATAYVIMAIRIAWFKIYKPLLFYSGFFSKRAVQFDYENMVAGSNAIRNQLISLNNIQQFSRKVKDENLIVTLGVALEMTKRGFDFLPIDINKSSATTFTMEEKGLRMPFSAIDGLGESVAFDIIEKRIEKPFTSREDVKERTKINKTVFEKLEQFGAFKDLKAENNVIDAGLFAL